jgi:hypothetical protein
MRPFLFGKCAKSLKAPMEGPMKAAGIIFRSGFGAVIHTKTLTVGKSGDRVKSCSDR